MTKGITFISPNRTNMKKILGFTEEKTMCECCGKQNLKGTYAIEFDGNDPVYYGSSCAFKKFGFTKEETKAADKQYSKDKTLMRIWNANTIEEALSKKMIADIAAKKAWEEFWAKHNLKPVNA